MSKAYEAKIEIKNIKVRLPRAGDPNDSTDFEANVFIDGKKAAVAHDNGWGGDTTITPVDEAGKLLVAKAEAYLKTLPEEKDKTHNFSIQMDLSLMAATAANKVEHQMGLKKDATAVLTKISFLNEGKVVSYNGRKAYGTDLAPYIGWLKEDAIYDPVIFQAMEKKDSLEIIMMLIDGSANKDEVNQKIVTILERNNYSQTAIEAAMGDRMPDSTGPR